MPASTEDILLKGFQSLNMESDRIETAQQVSALRLSMGGYLGVTLFPVLLKSILRKAYSSLLSVFRQFFSWFSRLQSQMDRDEAEKYRYGDGGNVILPWYSPVMAALKLSLYFNANAY